MVLYASNWRNGDLRTIIIIIDNLDSEQINDLNRRYGVSGLDPSNTLIVTHLWDTSNLLPTPTPTETPIPPPTAVPTSTSTAQPDTQPGTILKPGDIWYQGGMEIRLKNPTFVPGCNGILGFEFTIINNTGGEIVTNISGLDFAISDNAGQSYSDVWIREGSASESCYGNRLNRMEIRSMTAGQRIDIAVRVLGKPAQNVSQFTLTIYQAGRIHNAAWVIEVPK